MGKIGRMLALVGALVMAASGQAVGQQGEASAVPPDSGSIVIDRWLISQSYGKDSANASSIEDYLGIFEDVDFFPDRGQRVGTTIWTLYREDGVAEVDLDALFSERLENGIIFAHAYVWIPRRDRTLRLVTRGSCHYPRVMLNGHHLPWREADVEAGEAEAGGDGEGEGGDAATPLGTCPPGGLADTVLARFASGWNELLLGLDAGGGPYTFAAELLPGPGNGLSGIEIQASRPPGVRLGIPEPWITVPRFELSPQLVWYQDQLGGVVEYDLVGWGRAPRDDVRLELRIGGFKIKGDVDGLRARRPTTYRVLVPLEDLRDAGLGKDPVRMKIEWEDVTRRIEPGLPAADIVAAATRPVRGIGWLVPGALNGDRSPQEAIGATPPPLPRGSGETRAIEWKVPEELAGGSVLLEVGGSPAAWKLNGAPRSGGDQIELCQRCRKGLQLMVEATSTAAWRTYPVIVIRWEGSKAGRPNEASPEAWLSRLP
jgi:hypothetical protein